MLIIIYIYIIKITNILYHFISFIYAASREAVDMFERIALPKINSVCTRLRELITKPERVLGDSATRTVFYRHHVVS